VSEQNDASTDGLANRTERDRVLVQFDSDDPGTLTLLSINPTDLGIHPVQTGSSKQGVASLQRLAIVIGIRDCHTCPHGITAPQEGPKVGAISDP